MTKWNDAARAAADIIDKETCASCMDCDQIAEVILNHFAPLADLNAKLIDCVNCLLIGRATNGYMSPHWQAEMNRKLSDPIIEEAIVAAAIKGESEEK